MSPIFPFSTNRPQENSNKTNPDGSVVRFENKQEKGKAVTQAYLLEGVTHVGAGSDIAVDLLGKLYLGTMVDILQRDANNNICKIMYNIRHLESGDPLKIGEADFKYIVKSI